MRLYIMGETCGRSGYAALSILCAVFDHDDARPSPTAFQRPGLWSQVYRWFEDMANVPRDCGQRVSLAITNDWAAEMKIPLFGIQYSIALMVITHRIRSVGRGYGVKTWATPYEVVEITLDDASLWELVKELWYHVT